MEQEGVAESWDGALWRGLQAMTEEDGRALHLELSLIPNRVR